MRKVLILILLISILYAGFFKRVEVIEERGFTCDVMTREIAGYSIALAISQKDPYEIVWIIVRNPEGCLSRLDYTEHRYEKKN